MIALDNGFEEVVAIVASAQDSARRLSAVFGYQEIARGKTDAGALDALGIDATWDADEILIGDPSQKRGSIRFISFPDRVTDVARDGGQSWDTGGIFDINIRCLQSIEQQHAAMTRNGFVAFSPVIQWQFGPLNVKEVVHRDADGFCIAMMQRMAPPLTGYEDVSGPASYVFNSTQTVPDFAAARAFYVDVLGWKAVQESTWKHEDGSNCLGLPLDVAKTCELEVGIYHPHGVNEGSIEIIGFGVEGLDFSKAAPPSRGIASLRFPMSDPQAFLDKAAQGGCIIAPLRRAEILPYGEVEIGGVTTPWGAKLEVFRSL